MILRSSYKPQLNLNSTNVYAPTIKGYGYDKAIIDGGTYNALLTLSQTIIGKGNSRAQFNSYNLETQALSNAKKISEQDLKLAITTQYIATYSIGQEVSYSEAVRELLNKEDELLKKLTQRSVYKQTDYLSFQINLQQENLLISQQKAEYKNNIALLNYLCGIVDTTAVELLPPNIILQMPSAFEATLQYRKFQTDSLKLRNSDALIDYAYQPKLSVYADAGFNSTLTSQAYKNFGASVGLSLSIPLYDGKQRKQQHNKIKVSEQIRQDYQTFSNQQYKQQLAQLYQQLQETEHIINQAQTIITYTQTLMAAYGKQLQTGDVSITDYTIAINNYLSAKHTITQHLTNKMQIMNQINYWNYEK